MTQRILTVCILVLGAARAEPAQDPGWPREYKDDKGVLLVYQPQIEQWKDFKTVTARAAVEVYKVGEEEPILGAIELTIDSEVDHDERMVTLDKLKVTEATFPSIDSKARIDRGIRIMNRILPKGPVTISLDRILANLDRTEETAKPIKVSTKAPQIIVSKDEALLVHIDGDPMLEEIDGTGLLDLVNTPSTVLRHVESAKYYLLFGAAWLQAADLPGPWKPAATLPAGFSKLPDTPSWKDVRNKVPGMPLKPDEVPTVHVSQKPTELIVIHGEPDLKKIPKTDNLSYVANTESDLFFSGIDKKWYFLVSGRWFRSQHLEKGPWFFCTKDLVPDFARIPEDHTCGRVLASVPKTEQANEAVIAAQMPRTASVKRDEATLEVTYDGEPDFKLIEGTKVKYAVNTSLDVFEVDGAYYCCLNAIWFTAAAPAGPWSVCDKVPDEIYTIPSDDPHHNVTYVYVYNSTPEYVYVGYLPGYWGGYIHDDVVIYGTGYYYSYPRRYWRHWHRWHRLRPTPYGRGHRPTYGHGRYYDHLSGRYRKSANAIRHHSRRTHDGGVYSSWNKGVRRGGAGFKPPVAKPKPQPAPRVKKSGRQLYAGRDGHIYRKQGGEWQRHQKGGWQKAQLPTKRPQTTRYRTTQRHSLNRASYSRSYGARRSTHYRSYRGSRGTRTRSYRGGGRRGGRRR